MHLFNPIYYLFKYTSITWN